MREWSLEDTLRTHFQIELGEMYTALPCVITNVVGELSSQRIDVQPSINVLYKDGEHEEHTQILAVPVIFPGSRTSLISWPLTVGDTVYCIFSQRSMDNFKSGDGQPTVPTDYRKMDMQDAVAIPGLVPFGKSLNNPAVRLFPHSTHDLVISHNVGTATECEIRFKENGDIIVNTNFNVITNSKTAQVNATNSISLTAPVMNVNVGQTNWTGNITHSGNYTMTGIATFNGIPFMTHKHPGVQTGNGTSLPPIA